MSSESHPQPTSSPLEISTNQAPISNPAPSPKLAASELSTLDSGETKAAWGHDGEGEVTTAEAPSTPKKEEEPRTLPEHIHGHDSAQHLPTSTSEITTEITTTDLAQSGGTDGTSQSLLGESIPASPSASHPPKEDGGESARLTGSPSPPPPPPKDEKYAIRAKDAGLGIDTGVLGGQSTPQESGAAVSYSHVEVDNDSQSEIASIMEQFDDGKEGPDEQEIMSPRLEIGQPLFNVNTPQHPPRKSSLEPLRSGTPESLRRSSSSIMSPPPRTSSLAPASPAHSLKNQMINTTETDVPLSPQTSKSLPPPPQPDPEPDLPFDFQRFLEQLRHKSADPVAKYLRSFLLEFGKKQWMVHEQVKIISDFLEFITKKMAHCEVWRTVSDAEFDNAREGMEKLVMNRLYMQTFSPAIPAPEPAAGARGKRRAGDGSRPGRKGQHQEDVERDEVLAQKVRIYGWVRGEHLDIQPIGEKGSKFMDLAQKELLKIKSYRAPRDKVICVLNCCKVIFGFLRNAQSDQSADSFVPLLIYVVLRANPDHLVSNVQYILRFRNQDKLSGEAGYYISSLMGAIQFIENLDRTSLTISDEDFEKHVEAAVSAIAEKHTEELAPPPLPLHRPPPSPRLQPSEKSAIARPEVTPRNSMDAEQSTPRRSLSARNAARDTSARLEEEGEENAALAVLRTIQRPLSNIGRIFSDEGSSSASTGPAATPSRSPAPTSDEKKLSAEEAAARQANAEARMAREVSAREEKNLVETLSGMFPALDKEVIIDVVRANEGRVGKAVDACLALSAS